MPGNELIFWSSSGGEGGYMEGLVEQYNATNPKMTVRNVKLNCEYYTADIAVSVAVARTSASATSPNCLSV